MIDSLPCTNKLSEIKKIGRGGVKFGLWVNEGGVKR